MYEPTIKPKLIYNLLRVGDEDVNYMENIVSDYYDPDTCQSKKKALYSFITHICVNKTVHLDKKMKFTVKEHIPPVQVFTSILGHVEFESRTSGRSKYLLH
ncbi:hypothetical protein RF11_03961 [Thelohanellus kitauei]|uniref:Uncharacterized protein n=1 Tax=Thelohanellus kitauei TaxID=669202 RepID=A0A0C2MNP4_THEKT|nr:hypothetical protein RF11_03961 [Thelohanellus kitauei]